MSHAGLATAEAQRRLLEDGPNVLPTAGPRNTLAIALEVTREPMLLLLIGGAVFPARWPHWRLRCMCQRWPDYSDSRR